MEERIRELYQSGKGIKAIAKELNIPPATIRRRLISMNIYLGTERASHEEEIPSEGEELTPPLEQETIGNPVPLLEQWTPGGDATVKRDGDGWLVSLGSGFDAALVSPPLGEEWSGKGIALAVDLRLISPFSASLCLGVRDEKMSQGDEGSCLLQAGVVPSRCFIKHLCAASPVLYLKSNSYTPVTAHISSVFVREISTMGLKIIVAPPAEEKRFKPGERIDLANNWQADGADLFPCAWSAGALEVDFLSLTSGLFVQLPPETLNRKIKLTLTMRSLSGAFSLSAFLGDDEGKTMQEGPIKRVPPCTWELERDMGGGGYARLSCRTYSRETLLLEESYCEVLA